MRRLFQLQYEKWRLDPQLQIVQADVTVTIDGEIVLEESICVDVGMPAMLYSRTHDTTPSRQAAPEEWRRAPFWVCGCGDPACRQLFSLAVRHRTNGEGEEPMVELAEVEEREGEEPRETARYRVPAAQYAAEVTKVGSAFARFVAGRDYRPLLANTEAIVRDMLEE